MLHQCPLIIRQTLNNGPFATARLLQVPFGTRLEERLLSSSRSRNYSNYRTALVVEVQCPTGRHAKLCSGRRVRDNHGESARGSSQSTPVAWPQFNVADHRPLRNLSQ